MLEVVNFRVRTFTVEHLDLYWEIVPTSEDPFDYDFYVERSDHEHSGYKRIAGPFSDKYHFQDTTLKGISSHYRQWFYRLQVVDKKRGDDLYFPGQGGVTLRADPDLIALEAARNTQIRLQEFIGRLVWVFPIRTFGQYCTCVDSITQRKTASNCLVCYDTKYVGGYHQPIELMMQIIMPPEATTTADMGEIQNINATGRLSNYPEVHPRWMVVDSENTRWRIGEGIRRIEKGRALVRQDFPLHAVPKQDIEYRLPVNLTDAEKLALFSGPRRLFTNPQDVGEDTDPMWDAARGVYRA